VENIVQLAQYNKVVYHAVLRILIPIG